MGTGRDCIPRPEKFHSPSLFHLTRRMPASSPPRILVIRRRYLGDIVLLGPFLRNLRLHWPDANITVFVEDRFAEAYALNPDVNRILIQPAGNPMGIESRGLHGVKSNGEGAPEESQIDAVPRVRN